MTMKNNGTKKLLALVLVFVLTAAAALTGCGTTPAETTAPPAENLDITVLGEGAKSFELTIVDKEGVSHLYQIHTDEEMVGFALIKHELIEGEEGPYGMYIHSVEGEKAVYEEDNAYWAFYVGEDYANQGIDQTPIHNNTVYKLVWTDATGM
jgi:hypothetical protein